MEGTVRRVCFFYFSVTATLLLLFLLLSSSLWFLADLLQVLLFSSPLMFDFDLFLFHFCWMNGNWKKKIQKLKSKKFKNSFCLPSLLSFSPNKILLWFESQEIQWIYLLFIINFDSLFIWFEFKVDFEFLSFSLSNLLFFILSFLQCSSMFYPSFLNDCQWIDCPME